MKDDGDSPVVAPAMQTAGHATSSNPSVATLVATAARMLRSIGQVPALVRMEVSETATLSESHRVNAVQFEALYDITCGLCNEGHFNEAAPIALQLVAHQPANAAYAFLAGSCLQRLSLTVHAARLFAISMMLDAKPAAAAFRLGECLAAMEFPDDAQAAFDAAQALSRGDEDARTLQEMAFMAAEKFRRPN